jgi:hypothetical protein
LLKQIIAYTGCAAPILLNHGMPQMRPPRWWPLLFRGVIGGMRIQGRHWLEHDSIMVAALALGITVVMLLALSI